MSKNRAMRQKAGPLFWAKVNKQGGVPPEPYRWDESMGQCWLWLASTETTGQYGSAWNGARMENAHRVSYRDYYGNIPEGLHVDHLCRVKLCVNPLHLEAVTQEENNLRNPGWTGNMVFCASGRHELPERTGKKKGCRICHAEYMKDYYRKNVEKWSVYWASGEVPEHIKSRGA